MRTLLVAAVLIVAGCKKHEAKDGAAKAAATKPEEAAARPKPPAPADDEKPTPTEADTSGPSKEAAIQHLRDLNAALEAKDYKKALTFMAPVPSVDMAEVEKQLAKLVELKEISAAGIDVLAAKGKWGKLSEVVDPAQAERWASRFSIPVDQTWGFALDGATVGFSYDGKSLRLIRLNNVGKLAP